MNYVFDADLWRWKQRSDSWFFVRVPQDISDEIHDAVDDSGLRRGFGAVKVSVVIGSSSWKTSIFPESNDGCYVLPIKQKVRKQQDLDDGDVVEVSLSVIEGDLTA